MPSRREYLAIAGLGSMAGCLGGNESTTTERDPTPTATKTPVSTAPATVSTDDPAGVGEPVTVDGVDVTLERVAVQSSLAVVYTDSGDVIANTDGRFVLAAFDAGPAGPAAPAADRYTLVTAGERERPMEPGGGFWLSENGRREQYSTESATSEAGGGWLAFPVDGGLDAEAAQITVGSGAWALPERVTERLSQPAPRYELRSFDHPETVTPDEPFSVSLTVENVGSVAGTFRGVLNVRGVQYAVYPYPIRVDLEPGETDIWTKEYGPDEGLNDVDQTGAFDLRTPVGDREGEIEVIAGTAVGTATES
ncbi:hypothetical protein [Halolamina sp. C58]|uniref:hypothetical protein n=1 Tax=Halolamina sp. C58 TaxID=3421640 RepID=UPI003EBF6435